MEMNIRRTYIRWIAGLLIVSVICVTIVFLTAHPYVFRFEMAMDNNTADVMKLSLFNIT